ncbi:MAG: hypothetical protein JKY45_06615 [Emcibacter sp.]|nr:hypothetical protein [Emcibacter sp.]
MKNILVLTLALMISACASTGVVPMGQDTYFIGKKDGSTGLGVSYKVKAAVYKEANDFCGAKSLAVETLEVVTTPARLAQLGSTELKFKCVAAQ